MEEEIRPVIRQVLAAYSVTFVLILAAPLVLLSLLSPPPFVFFPVAILVLILGTAFFAFETAKAYWTYLTQRYAIGEDHVRIQRGWASKTSETIPSQNIAEVRAVMPLFLRMLGVGLVVIDTNDGNRHVLNNVKDPEGLAKTINPVPAGEPVTRPSVG